MGIDRMRRPTFSTKELTDNEPFTGSLALPVNFVFGEDEELHEQVAFPRRWTTRDPEDWS